MKKIIAMILLGLISAGAFCFDYDKDNFSVELDLETALFVYKDKIYVLGYDQKLWEDKRPEKIVNEHGYALLHLNENPYRKSTDLYFFDLNGDIIFDDTFPPHDNREEIIELFKLVYGCGSVNEIKASSELTEVVRGKKIVYAAENVLNLGKEKESPYFFRTFGEPWVPDIKKDKNPHIDFELQFEATTVHILPGFVDLERQHLWKQNARPKTIEVFDLDSSESLGKYIIKDSINFTSINLPKPVKKVRIKFLDFYAGTKYQDPCVSAIHFGTDQFPPKYDYGKKVFEKDGYFEKLLKKQTEQN